MSERRHTPLQRPVTQHPEQGSWRGLSYFRLVERRHAAPPFTIRTVASGAFASIQFGARAQGRLLAFHGIGYHRRLTRSLRHETRAVSRNFGEQEQEHWN